MWPVTVRTAYSWAVCRRVRLLKNGCPHHVSRDEFERVNGAKLTVGTSATTGPKRLGFFSYALRILSPEAGVDWAVRKECVGRGLAMWIAWVAAGCRWQAGRVVWTKSLSAGRDSELSRMDRQGSVGAGLSNLSGFDGPVVGLACLAGKLGESE